MTMRIAAIGRDDIEPVVALWEHCGLTRPWNDPRADIALALKSPDADVFVGQLGDDVVASVMVGFDGHRGWVYYLAVAPDARGGGFGRRMMAAAEDWLRARGAPKLQLLVRDENTAVAAFYERLGYELQATKVLGKWLVAREDDAPVNFVDSPI
jgi:ribosomal protein S18 acetylase RimI-like enzyme